LNGWFRRGTWTPLISEDTSSKTGPFIGQAKNYVILPRKQGHEYNEPLNEWLSEKHRPTLRSMIWEDLVFSSVLTPTFISGQLQGFSVWLFQELNFWKCLEIQEPSCPCLSSTNCRDRFLSWVFKRSEKRFAQDKIV
jgi:hypothetical protein